MEKATIRTCEYCGKAGAKHSIIKQDKLTCNTCEQQLFSNKAFLRKD